MTLLQNPYFNCWLLDNDLLNEWYLWRQSYWAGDLTVNCPPCPPFTDAPAVDLEIKLLSHNFSQKANGRIYFFYPDDSEILETLNWNSSFKHFRVVRMEKQICPLFFGRPLGSQTKNDIYSVRHMYLDDFCKVGVASKWVKPHLQNFLSFLSIIMANFPENLVTIA